MFQDHWSLTLMTSKKPSGKDLSPPQNQNRGMFYQAHNISATGNFIDGEIYTPCMTDFPMNSISVSHEQHQ
jgi:hypothetical protein